MPFWEDDINIFFNDFGLDAVYNGSTTIKVIFDNSFEAVNLQTGEIEGAGPQALIKTSDAPNAAHGQTLVINSITYKIRGIEPDGTGITRLILSKD